jgi:Ferritin-like domain
MHELELDILDTDGALRESFAAVPGATRRAFLASAAGGAALYAGLSLPATASASVKGDQAILNYALTLEYLQSSFYTEAERLRAIKGPLARIPRQLGAVERAHVRALRTVLGRQAVARPSFNFQGTTEDPDAFLRTAVAFEDLAAAAYKGQAAAIESPGILAAAIAIHSVEARHAAWMRYLAGVRPATSAFDQGKSEREVKRIVASTRFIAAAPRRTKKGKKPRFTG